MEGRERVANVYLFNRMEQSDVSREVGSFRRCDEKRKKRSARQIAGNKSIIWKSIRAEQVQVKTLRILVPPNTNVTRKQIEQWPDHPGKNGQPQDSKLPENIQTSTSIQTTFKQTPALCDPPKKKSLPKSSQTQHKTSTMQNAQNSLPQTTKTDKNVMVSPIISTTTLNNATPNSKKAKKIKESCHYDADIVVCFTQLNREDERKLNIFCQLFKIEKTREWSKKVTHLISKVTDNKFVYTWKYFMAISAKLNITSFQWIIDSLESGKLEQHLKYDFGHLGLLPSIMCARSLTGKPPFKGYTFYFDSARDYKRLSLTTENVHTMLRNVGAEIITSTEGHEGRLTIIGEANGNKQKYNDWLNSNQWETVTFDWIIQCVINFKIIDVTERFSCTSKHADTAQCTVDPISNATKAVDVVSREQTPKHP